VDNEPSNYSGVGMIKALPKQCAGVLDGDARAEMLSELRQFERNRKAEGLPFDVKLVPERWADQDHLAAEYEDNVQAAEGKEKAKRMSSAKPSASVKLVTMKHLDWVIQMIGGEIGKHVEQLEDQNAKLEARVAELERLSFEFAGTWQQGKAYRRGQFVSWRGGLWHCNCETTRKPGTSSDFTLCCKAGRYAKDAK
jgi:hypothetical protein